MTAPHARGGFWLTNHIVNPIVVLVLRSPLGRRIGRHLGLLAYRGQRSDRRYELVVQCAREGSRVWIVSGQPQRKTWWRNLRTTSPVELRLAGDVFRGQAVVLGDERPDELRRALTAYSQQLPRAAKSLGIESREAGDCDPAVLAIGTVVVQVDLENNVAIDRVEHSKEPAP